MDKKLLKSLHYTLHINIHSYNAQENKVYSEFIFYSSDNFLYNYQGIVQQFPENKLFHFVSGSYEELFLLYKDTSEDSILIFGPFLSSHVSLQNILDSLPSKQATLFKEDIKAWLETTPLFSIYDISHILRLVHFCQCQENRDLLLEDFNQHLSYFIDDKCYNTPHNPCRKKQFFHHIYDYENEIIELVKTGDLEKLYSEKDLLSSSHIALIHFELIDQKLYFITFSEKLSQAAISSGVSIYQVYSLREKMIADIYSANSKWNLIKIIKLYVTAFTKEIGKIKQMPYINDPLVHSVVQYFKQSDTDDFSIKKLAKQLNMSQSKLSKDFKMITNCTISQYITELRIREAKEFLAHDYQISDVAELLGFKDTSHFSKVFKAATSLSPQQYKNKNRLK